MGRGETMEAMRRGQRHAAWLAWAVFGLTVAMAVGTAAFGFVDDGTVLAEDNGVTVGGPGELLFALMTVVFAGIGSFLASRRPRNPVAWILCLAPLFLGYTGVARGWYVHTVYADPGSLPLSDWMMWAANWAWIPGFPPLLTLLPFLFPEGRAVRPAGARLAGWPCWP